MTQNEISALVSAIKTQLSSELKDAIIEALKEEVKDAVKETPKRKFHGKPSNYTPAEGEVNVCEYSEKQIAVWGDLKGKTELLDIIKQYGTAKVEKREYRATFIRSLASLLDAEDNHPCGWLLMKEAVNANGGEKALTDALADAGAMVTIKPSVKDTTEANKADRKAERKADAPKTPKADAPKADKPKAKPTPSKVIKGAKCYEPAKNDEQFEVKERDLVSRGNYFFYQAEKGAAVYIKGGVDAETGEDVYALITKVKGDITKAIHPDAPTWTEIATLGIVKAVEDNKLQATSALMNAVARYGTDEDIDVLWNKLSA